MRYTMYSCSTHEAIDTLEMHVLAKAYHCAWRSAWASDPAGPHLVHALDLIIDFGRFGPMHAARAAPAVGRGSHPHCAAAPPAQACDPGSRESGMGGLEIAAAEFARRAHTGQVLEDGVTPYFEGHVMAVVDILIEIGASEETIVAGYLHDVVAITTTSLDQVEEAFGARIAALVGAASGAGRYPETPGGAQQLDRLATESAEVQTLALAHDLANLRNPQWLRQAVRAGALAEMAERVDRLVLADAQLQRHVRAALALWRAIPWAFGPGEPGK
jgi:hypothetical protein